MSRELQFPRSLVFDESYWLCRCGGFRVETSTRRLGVVVDVRYRSRVDRPDELVVRAGLLGRRIVVVPVSEVAGVVPRAGRVILRPRSGAVSS